MSELGLSSRVATVKEAARLMKQGMDMLSHGPFMYDIEQLCGSVEYLMDRYCPIKPGDRVELLETPVINEKESWGWIGAKHFLVAGARGVARDVNCSSSGIRVYVAWDDETWKSSLDGTLHPMDSESLYCHCESTLRKAEAA